MAACLPPTGSLQLWVGGSRLLPFASSIMLLCQEGHFKPFRKEEYFSVGFDLWIPTVSTDTDSV